MTNYITALAFSCLATTLFATEQTQPVALTIFSPVSSRQDWGSLAVDHSVAGKPLQIGDRKFEYGLGTHAKSEITYDLHEEYGSFDAWVGVDADVAGYNPCVIFQVIGDGRKLYDSGPMRIDTPAKHLRVDISGVSRLTLVALNGGRTWGSHLNIKLWGDKWSTQIPPTSDCDS